MDARLVVPGTVGAPSGEAIVRDARAGANAGLAFGMLEPWNRLETRRVVGSHAAGAAELGGALWHELGALALS